MGGPRGAAGRVRGSRLVLRGQSRGRPPSVDPIAREGPGISLRLFSGTAEEARGLVRPARVGGRARRRRGTPSATGFSAWPGARPRLRSGARRGRGRRCRRPDRRPGSGAEPMTGLDVPVSSKLIPGGGRWGMERAAEAANSDGREGGAVKGWGPGAGRLRAPGRSAPWRGRRRGAGRPRRVPTHVAATWGGSETPAPAALSC